MLRTIGSLQRRRKLCTRKKPNLVRRFLDADGVLDIQRRVIVIQNSVDVSVKVVDMFSHQGGTDVSQSLTCVNADGLSGLMASYTPPTACAVQCVVLAHHQERGG